MAKDETRIDDLDAPRATVAHPITEAEPQQVYGVEQADVDYELLLRKFEQRAKFVEGVRKAAVGQTRPHHWIGRGSQKQETLYNLQGPGAEQIRTLCGIGFEGVRQWEDKWTKEAGPGYTIWFEARAYLADKRSGLLPVMGSCSSDDDFFSTEHAYLPYNEANPEQQALLESGEGKLSQDKKTLYVTRRIPASEVTRESIVKSALTNLIVNGVTRVLGIRQLTAEQLKAYGVDVEKAPVANYGSTRKESGKLAPELEQKRREIWKWLVEMSGGDEAAAKASLKKRTAFNDFAGVHDPAKLTEKQIGFHYDKIKADYQRHTGDAPAAAPQPAKQQQKAAPPKAPTAREPGED
jgi:hypothetical protein